MNESLKEKRIVLTGGTTGIGRTTALLLASEGARVLIFGRHQQELDDALTEIGKVGEVHGLIADTAKYDDVILVFAEADEKLGGVDILINNAGLPAGSIIETTFSEAHYAIETMLTGYLACATEAYKRMKQQGKGQIVNIGSMSAEVLDPESDIYVAAKSGVRGFTISLRKKVNGENIKVALIEPGLVGTSLHEMPPEKQRQEEKNNKMLLTEDVANTVLWILTQPWRSDVILVQVKPIGQVGI